MVAEPRNLRLEIRIAPSEAEMLRELAEAEGLSQADVLRQCIRSRHAARFGEKLSKKKSK
jgi:hypothetical protein